MISYPNFQIFVQKILESHFGNVTLAILTDAENMWHGVALCHT